MGKASQVTAIAAMTIIYSVLSPSVSLAAGGGVRCEALFTHERFDISKPLYSRGKDEKVDYQNDRSYLIGMKNSDKFGRVQSVFDRNLDTRIYYTATATPTRNGQKIVDSEAKAIYVFFHGSGTMQSGGKNFYGIMNKLASMGYGALSFDMPFHAEGPIRDQFYDVNYYMKWVRQVVGVAKSSGRPVYLVGHSFGPDAIAEYLYRYPNDVQGAALLSPAGFTPVLEKWYNQHTSKMKFGGEVPANELAGRWAYSMSKQFIWNKSQSAGDPTLLNPDLIVRMLSGDREEYVPAPVGGSNRTPIGKNTYNIANAFRRFFKNSTTTIEPGIGHYIFNHNDSNGHNVVMREVLALDGESLKNEKKIKEETGIRFETRNEAQKLAFKYHTDPLFQAWVDLNISSQLPRAVLDRNNIELAKTILAKYDLAREERDRGILNQILDTQETMPRFYQAHKDRIESLRKSGKLDTSLFLPYLAAKWGELED